MSIGKLTLLLVIGGLAGAGFAAITTGALPSYRKSPHAGIEHSHSISVDAQPAHRSWLDEGLSALNSPAWPFGRGEDDSRAPARPDGYAPYGYGPPDDDDQAWERRQYGQRDALPLPDYPAAADYPRDEPTRPDASSPESATPRADAAADAAARAANAAQDVIAAEGSR